MLTQEQLEMRASGLGASEVGGALGLSRYTSPWQVWGRKLGMISPFADTWDTQRGNILEPAILAWYARTTGVTLEAPGTLRHPKHACILCTPDSIASKDGRRWLVECKAPSVRTARYWGVPGTDAIDAEYIPQAVQQMAVCDLDWCDFAVSIGGEEPEIYRVHRDESVEVLLLGRACSWWDRHIIGRQPPKVDGSDEARTYLSGLHDSPSRLWLQADDQAEALARGLKDARRRQAAATGDRERLENRFRAIIADAEGIEGDGWRCSWKPRKDGVRVLRFTTTEEG